MAFDGDDDDGMPSSTERLLHADAHTDKLERKAAAKGKILSQLQLEKLKHEVKPMSAQTDEQQSRATDESDTEHGAKSEGQFGTKTMEQTSREQVLTAQEKTTSDSSVQEEQRTEDQQQQAKEEYQQNMG